MNFETFATIVHRAGCSIIYDDEWLESQCEMVKDHPISRYVGLDDDCCFNDENGVVTINGKEATESELKEYFKNNEAAH